MRRKQVPRIEALHDISQALNTSCDYCASNLLQLSIHVHDGQLPILIGLWLQALTIPMALYPKRPGALLEIHGALGH